MIRLATIVLLSLTALDNKPILVNPNEITSMRGRMEAGKNFPPQGQCLVNLSDGKYVTVKETCEAIREMIK